MITLTQILKILLIGVTGTLVINVTINVKIFALLFILCLVCQSYFVRYENHLRTKKIVEMIERK
jgi:hypothetical protein